MATHHSQHQGFISLYQNLLWRYPNNFAISRHSLHAAIAPFSFSRHLQFRQNVDNRQSQAKLMQRYTLTDTRDRNSKVFEKAAIEPVLVTERSLP